MYLSRIEIENFRGIRSARLDFNETTVLVGENDSGKTALIEAICCILAPSAVDEPVSFKNRDFYMESSPDGYRPLGSLSIKLTFRERVPDEWSFIRNNDFGLVLVDDAGTLQELFIEVKADPAGTEDVQAAWRIGTEGAVVPEFSGNISILTWIRGLNPVFQINNGIMPYMPEQQVNDASPHGSGTLEANRELAEKIGQAYRNLVAGLSVDNAKDLNSGYRAALGYLSDASDMFVMNSPLLDKDLYKILGSKVTTDEKPARRIFLRHGSAAEQIGMLLFTTSLLQSGGFMADPSSEPIIIIEDPEAHLHPMTLEAVKLLIERLKWQKIITTYSGSLLSEFPLEDLRRITRNEGYIRQFRVKPGMLTNEELRRISYHVRKRINTATFARCWLLVEGESESWLLPYLAKLCGYDFMMEGVVCVEFAQCGIAPLVKVAKELGIAWFLLADGDSAGKAYIESAKHFALQAGENFEDHCLRLREKDIEHHFFFNGYAAIYQEYSGIPPHVSQNMQPRRIIDRALHRNSKPFMAIAVVEAIARPDTPGVPFQLKNVIQHCVRLAKGL